MRLKDLVQIDNRFEKSVNLLLDLNDKKKVNAYILTRSSINLLKDYLREVTGFSGRRANILIGPYGKGKSHLLLVLMAILSGKPSNELTMLFEKIKHIDIDAAETIEAINKSYRFLPVIINTTSGNLSQAFVRSLNYALIREGLNDIVPDSYFSEAIKAIKQWRDVYPDTFCAFKKSISCSAEDFIHYLEMYDYNAIADFRKIHPTITSGSEFNPIIDDEAISVYRSINRTLCEKYGYSGIYIIFDEFSKYIEGHTEEGFSADMKLLQDICELSNSSHKEQLHLTCVAHKAIRAYGDTLSKKVQNSFRGVEGRLVEIPFTVSSQNNYELISDAILKKDEFYNWEGNSSFKSILDESFQIPAFSALFKNDDFIKIVGEGCFPLTPFAALLLTQLSEKIAQNERTIFTFISGKDLNSLAVFVEKSEHVAYAGAGLIYDYFLPLFQGEKNTSIHNEWLKAEYALAKAGAPEEQSIIKSLSVIRMVNIAEDVPANDKYLRLASGMDTDVVSHALKSLIERGLITFKKKNAAYDFQNNIGVTSINKDFLMVFDFVDNANMFNCPYSLHRLFHISEYNPGGLVLGKKEGIQWDQDMFRKGEKPEVLVDYPVHVTDYEQIDLFNWQEKAEGMLSLMELTRRINVRAKQIRKCIREGSIVPDMIIPVSEKKSFLYFETDQVKKICNKFGWTEITNSNRKNIFIDNIKRMQMDHSYKPVFLLSFFDHMDSNGTARIEDVLDTFIDFYEDRKSKGLMAEMSSSVFLNESYTRKDAEHLMLSMPFRIYEEMGVMNHSKYIGTIQLDKQIAKRLDVEDIDLIRKYCRDGICKYYSGNRPL